MSTAYLKLATSDDAWRALWWPVFWRTFVVSALVALALIAPPFLLGFFLFGDGLYLLFAGLVAPLVNGYFSSIVIFWLVMKKSSGIYRYALFVDGRETPTSFKNAFRFGKLFFPRWLLYYVGIVILGLVLSEVFNYEGSFAPGYIVFVVCFLQSLATLDGPFYVAASSKPNS